MSALVVAFLVELKPNKVYTDFLYIPCFFILRCNINCSLNIYFTNKYAKRSRELWN